ncbi:MAG: MBL fold metallo-hydrolase [Dehalococcoidia bacterium]|nr:MBL fold metallo-hydrolase [Dehalococcoidia bacterium]
MKLTFHGAVRNVTGSMHLVELDQRRILLDCGLYQGRRKETYERNLNFPFDPSTLNALVLSHAHIDHLGNVPNLVKRGFSGDIHLTLATADLANVMLHDAAHLQESDAKFASKVRQRHNQPPVEPLFVTEDIAPVLELFETHSYNRWFKMMDGVRAIFREAGHILGSAITVMVLDDGGKDVSICYTGDLGRKDLPIIRDPAVVNDADVLIIESTYGERLHGDIRAVREKLARVVNETISRGGKILVPSFALERAQELIYTLHRMRLDRQIPEFPVYVDSPLATDATAIFRLHPECFDREINEFMNTVDDPFGFRYLRYVSSAEESKALNDIKTPMMIIAGSGMAEGGRILHHLKNNIEDPRNTVLIVGWQAENTLGRKIAEKWEKVPIFGEPYRLKSQVEVFDEFSAHADRNDLVSWVSHGKNKWRQVFIVHGEESASMSLAEALRELGLHNVIVPEPGQSFVI